jgi:hypothetical protein
LNHTRKILTEILTVFLALTFFPLLQPNFVAVATPEPDPPSGFNFLLNWIALPQIDAEGWFDVSVSAYVPVGTTGVVLSLEGDFISRADEVRKKGSTDNFGLTMASDEKHTVFVGLDENYRFQARKGQSGAGDIRLIGYTDEAVFFFTNVINITPSTSGTWVSIDLSSYIPSDATGIITRIRSPTFDGQHGGVRHPSSTSEASYGRIASNSFYSYQLCGVNTSQYVQAKISDTSMRVDLVGYVKKPVTFKVDPVELIPSSYDTWVDVDITTYTSNVATGALFLERNSHDGLTFVSGVRPKGTTSYAGYKPVYMEQSKADGVKLDASQVFQTYSDNDNIHLYIVAYTEPVPVSIGEFQSPSTVYANQWLWVNATVQHTTDINRLVNATLELSNNVILKWDNATNTFSIYYDPSNYAIINTTASTRTTINATSYRLSWRIQFNWTYPEGTKNIVLARVEESEGMTATNAKTNIFTFEDDLIVATATVDDSHVNPNQTIIFNATIYYEGTTTPPENTSGIIAKLKLGTNIVNSTTTIGADGKFTLSTNVSTSVDKYTYTLLATTDQDSVQNQNIDVTVDKLSVIFSAYPTEAGKDQTVTISWEIKRYYDGSTVTSFNIDISRNSTLWKSLANTTSTTDVHDTLVTYVYNVYASSVTDNTYDLNTWTSTPVYVTWMPQEEKPPSEEAPPAPPPAIIPPEEITPTPPAFDITQILAWIQQNSEILISLIVVVIIIIYAWRKR